MFDPASRLLLEQQLADDRPQAQNHQTRSTTRTTRSTTQRVQHPNGTPQKNGATAIMVGGAQDSQSPDPRMRDANHNWPSTPMKAPTIAIDSPLSSPTSPMSSADVSFDMLHSPGGQSTASWGSLPSGYMSPYPPGKDPITIPVQSPTPSESSQDGQRKVREVPTKLPEPVQSPTPKQDKFLQKVTRELDDQRKTWKGDVDRLTGGMIGLGVEGSPNGIPQGTNSFVDTSSGRPIFRSAVDMTGFSPKDITVTVDKLMNKVVIQGIKPSRMGSVNRSFTQRVQLPRFADDQQLRTKLSKTGQLKIEVPLLYYFDDQKQGRQAKSFVYQVNTDRAGNQRLEILVNTGSGYRARDLKIKVHDDDKLVIIGEKPDMQGNIKRKLIKQYTLPKKVNIDAITSKLGKDGRLQVNLPLHKGATIDPSTFQ